MTIRPRASAQTHQTTVTIELSGHRCCDASLEVEVEYERTADIPVRLPSFNSPGEPAEGGEVEIVEVRPYRTVMDRGSQIKRKEYLDAPPWLLDLIRECIDTDLLTGEWP